MEEIPEIISPHSDYSPKLSLTPKNEKSIYMKELNIFKRKQPAIISFTHDEKLTPWDYHKSSNDDKLTIIIPKINYNNYCSPIKKNKSKNKSKNKF